MSGYELNGHSYRVSERRLRLRARVRQITGRTEHYESALERDSIVRKSRLPNPETVEIQEGDNGYYLFYLDANGACIADTWHLALGDAKAQAKFEFQIDEWEWIEVRS